MKAIITSCFLAVALTACQTYNEMSAEDRASALRVHSKKCTDFGFKNGTNKHAECVRLSVAQYDQGVLNERAAAASAPVIINHPAPSYNRPVYCTGTSFGTIVNATCF